MSSLPLEGLTFKEIEREIFKIGCEAAKMLMKELLEKVDKDLAESRDKKKLRHKGKKTTTIKTLMGEVNISRSIYRRENEKGETEHVHLLDKALGFETIGSISPNLAEKILDYSCEMPYRGVAQAVSELTNQTISHQGVWNIIQAVGEQQIKAEQELILAHKNNRLTGKREIAVLFEEADGLWLSMQGKSRQKSSKGKKELKIGVCYEGWTKRYPSSKEYKTVEKIAIAGYTKPAEFKKLKEATIAAKYNVDEIRYHILNGDGAQWIKNGHDQESSIFQLDPYHLAQSVTRNVPDKNSRTTILKWLKAGEFEKVYKKLEELKYETGEAKEVEKLVTLEKYIKSNQDGIVSYKDREDLDMPEPPAGLEYRNLGTMERNVNIFAKRMKGAKSWSEQGATNLAKIIALKLGNDFKEKAAALVSGQVSERLTEPFEEKIINTKDYLKKTARRAIHPLHKGVIPFSNCSMTNGRRFIRSMFDMQSFTQMIYR